MELTQNGQFSLVPENSRPISTELTPNGQISPVPEDLRLIYVKRTQNAWFLLVLKSFTSELRETSPKWSVLPRPRAHFRVAQN